jgi:hypothetical protein
MKKLMLVSSAAALMCAFLVRPLWSDDEGSGDGKGAAPAVPEWTQPGPEHKALSEQVGTWGVHGKFWEPGHEKPSESDSTSTITSILDGRYVQEDMKGKIMGMDMHGMGIFGFDRVDKKYTAYWCDSWSTQPMSMTGDSKDGGKTIEYSTTMTNGMTNKTDKYRLIYTRTSADAATVVMYGGPEGKDKAMELAYTRKK